VGLRRRLYLSQHPGHLRQHLLVRKAQHSQTAPAQNLCTLPIILRLPLVNRAVDLHHKRCSVAVEVHDKPIDDLLPPEVQPSQAIRPDPLPQGCLGPCLVVAQPPRQLALHDPVPPGDDP